MPDADRAAFLELQAAFVRGLAARLDQVRSHDPATRDKALHQLAGAAGAYELDELGHMARAVQAALRSGDTAAADALIETLAAAAQARRAASDTIP